jgi:hypothetical protein
VSGIFLIRTPVREVAGMAYGGPLRLRGATRAAYAGFRTAGLAGEVARFWGITSEHFIEPWTEALRHELPGAGVRQVVVFDSRADFDRYLHERERFDFDSHTVALHPVLMNRRRAGVGTDLGG